MKRDAKRILKVNSWLSAVFFAAVVLMVGSMVCRGQENYVRTAVFT